MSKIQIGKDYGNKKARYVIFQEKDRFRLSRGYIRKGGSEIIDLKTKYFNTKKKAVEFANKWLKNR